jgi:hypothetical protein
MPPPIRPGDPLLPDPLFEPFPRDEGTEDIEPGPPQLPAPTSSTETEIKPVHSLVPTEINEREYQFGQRFHIHGAVESPVGNWWDAASPINDLAPKPN